MTKSGDRDFGRSGGGAGDREGVTRRGFGQKVGAGAVGLAGLGLAGGLARAADPQVDFIETSCGEEREAAPRVLVGYASCCGSTGGVAEAIGLRLCAAGARVDVKLLKDVDALDGYDALVLGSAIQAGRWLPEAQTFIARRRKLLRKVPVAYFAVCLALSQESPQTRKLGQSYVAKALKLAPRVEPVATSAFAGAVDYAKMPKKYRAIMRRIGAQDGDWRDWEKIKAWADEVAGKILIG